MYLNIEYIDFSVTSEKFISKIKKIFNTVPIKYYKFFHFILLSNVAKFCDIKQKVKLNNFFKFSAQDRNIYKFSKIWLYFWMLHFLVVVPNMYNLK